MSAKRWSGSETSYRPNLWDTEESALLRTIAATFWVCTIYHLKDISRSRRGNPDKCPPTDPRSIAVGTRLLKELTVYPSRLC
jgi:hypothetical protein